MTQFEPSETQVPTPSRRSRQRRWIVRIVVALLVLFIAGELFARFYLGLGDPPLSVADPEIEYLFKPSQEVRRFGNRIHYNAYSMRADDFAEQKSDARELRVLVLGDSVINGGALTDQANIVTEILKRELTAKLGRPVVVGNVSAATWGPPNLLAYVKRFGFFDADVIVFVYSSHDYADVPTFQPVVGVSPNYPDHRPMLALEELWSRYLWPRVAGAALPADAGVPPDAPPKQSDIDQSMFAVRELLARARSTGASVIVAQHLEATEQNGTLLPGHDRIMNAARDAGVAIVQFGPLETASLRAGRNPYRDSIHPNAIGQQVMAEALLEPIERALRSRIQPATAPVDRRGTGG